MLLIQNGESKGIQVGVTESEARQRFKSLMDLFTMYPTQINIFNKTKTCNVQVHVINNAFNITVTNPEDEVFKL
jgi:hypothetical protein